MLKFVNNWKYTLQAPLGAAGGQLQVSSAAAARLVGLGTGDTYRLTLVEVDSSGAEVAWEIVTASANAAGLLTVSRGEEGTAARDWAEGALISLRLTAGTLEDLVAVAAGLDDKVDKLPGYGLSQADFTPEEKAKLGGVAAGATANDTDANLKNRANHTGTQAISTVSGLQQALDKATFAPVVTEEGTARTAGLSDAGSYLRFTNAAASAYTIAPQAAVAWGADAEIHVRRAAAANLTLTAGSGVTLNAPSGGTLVMTNAMSVTLKRVAENVWDVIGQTVAA